MKIKIALFAVVLVLASAVWMAVSRNSAAPFGEKNAARSVVATLVGDKQIVEVNVKEGYQPREIIAKADVPVLLKMKTQGVFDCTSVFSIPSLGERAQLPSTGETVIEIPAQKAGGSVRGVCGMGMYSLVITFT